MWFQSRREYDSRLRLHFTNTYHLLNHGNNASLINFSYASAKVIQLFFFQSESPQALVMFSCFLLIAEKAEQAAVCITFRTQ